MNQRTLVFRSLRFNFRTHLGVLAGCAISSAVLVGALFVGDSARGSMERIALARLGDIHVALDTGSRTFRGDLAERLGADASALLRVRGMAIGSKQVNRVNVLGVDESFFGLVNNPPQIDLSRGNIAVNEKLAAAVGVKVGDDLSLRMFKPGLLAGDAPLASGKTDNTSRAIFTVTAVLSDDQMGRFSLKSDQAAPYNAFVDLAWLQERLELDGRANMLVAGSNSLDLESAWTLDDIGLSVRLVGELVQLESLRIYIDPAVSDVLHESTGSLTYLVNSITSESGKTTPYSFMTAISPTSDRRLGPIPAEMKDDEIIVNRWLADHLSIGEGDPVTVAYSELTAGNKFIEKQRTFRVREIVAMEALATEKELVPGFPGLTDVDTCEDWDIGITTDAEKLKDEANEAYWKSYRQTPKAFVTLAAGQEMWGNRYGDLMAVRSLSSENPGTSLRERLDPATVGLVLRPVRAQAMEAASKSMDLGGLFLGMSIFLIAASLILTAMLFVFSIEQRAKEMGIFKAVGYTAGRVRVIFLAEGFVLAALGSLAGIPLGWGFSKLLIGGLESGWSGAVAGASVQFHATVGSAVAGAIAATLISLGAMGVTLWRQAKRSVRELVSEDFSLKPRRAGRGGRIVFWLATAGAVAVAVLTLASGAERPAEGFFLAGSLMLIGGIAGVRMLLTKEPRGRLTVRSLGVRNAGRRPGRGLAAAAMLACGCFMVFSVSAMKEDFSTQAGERKSPTGGFELLAESSIAISQDLDASIFPIRVQDGDDASCLNLNLAPTPPLLGVNAGRLTELGAFADVWGLLDEELPGDVIPAIVGDSATAVWKLRKKVGEDGDLLEYRDERGKPFQVKLVAALPMRLTVFQGKLLISEQNFTRLYPSEGGYRMFLGDASLRTLGEKFEKAGLDVIPSVDRLKEYYVVESTYLMMFLVLGGMGLLLGTAGMGVLVLRNVMERRGELTLLRAVGYSRGQTGSVVMSEHLFLVAAGVVTGTLASALAIGPSLARPEIHVPVGLLAGFLIGTTALSVAWVWIATRLALRAPLIPALRNE